MGPLPPVADLSAARGRRGDRRATRRSSAGRLHFVLPTAIGATTTVDRRDDRRARRARRAAIGLRGLTGDGGYSSRCSLQLREQHLVADLQQLRRAALVVVRLASAPVSILMRLDLGQRPAASPRPACRTDRSAPTGSAAAPARAARRTTGSGGAAGSRRRRRGSPRARCSSAARARCRASDTPAAARPPPATAPAGVFFMSRQNRSTK